MKDIHNIKISKATTSDAEGIQNLTVESSKGMYKLCGWSQEDIDNHFNPEKIKEGAERLKESIKIFTDVDILFVAKDEENKIVGCCFADKQDDVNKIEAVYVLEDFQGTGLAKKLYDVSCELLNPNNDTFLDVFSLNSKV
jgi:N-acetylglutamate synthase-like GNAT family acetyltransferase